MATLKEFLKADRFATCAGVELLEIKPGYTPCVYGGDRPAFEWWRSMSRRRLFTLTDLAFAAVANSRKKLTLSVNAKLLFSVLLSWVTCMLRLLKYLIIIVFLC